MNKDLHSSYVVRFIWIRQVGPRKWKIDKLTKTFCREMHLLADNAFQKLLKIKIKQLYFEKNYKKDEKFVQGNGLDPG